MTQIVNIRVEKCDVFIGRPSKWGNPFVIGKDGTREEVIQKYKAYILTKFPKEYIVSELKDKKLGCYCYPLPCHGDILKEICDT